MHVSRLFMPMCLTISAAAYMRAQPPPKIPYAFDTEFHRMLVKVIDEGRGSFWHITGEIKRKGPHGLGTWESLRMPSFESCEVEETLTHVPKQPLADSIGVMTYTCVNEFTTDRDMTRFYNEVVSGVDSARRWLPAGFIQWPGTPGRLSDALTTCFGVERGKTMLYVRAFPNPLMRSPGFDASYLVSLTIENQDGTALDEAGACTR